MPTRADMEAATPKCPGVARQTQYGATVEKVCGQPLAWDHARALWRCPEHGDRLTARAAADRVVAGSSG